jgi:hypothetical protein
VLPYLIAELRTKRGKEHLFDEAAKTFLGLDEAIDVNSEELLAALRSGNH